MDVEIEEKDDAIIRQIKETANALYPLSIKEYNAHDWAQYESESLLIWKLRLKHQNAHHVNYDENRGIGDLNCKLCTRYFIEIATSPNKKPDDDLIANLPPDWSQPTEFTFKDQTGEPVWVFLRTDTDGNVFALKDQRSDRNLKYTDFQSSHIGDTEQEQHIKWKIKAMLEQLNESLSPLCFAFVLICRVSFPFFVAVGIDAVSARVLGDQELILVCFIRNLWLTDCIHINSMHFAL